MARANRDRYNRRSYSERLPLYYPGVALGWRVKNRVSLTAGMRMVDAGCARVHRDDFERIYAFELLEHVTASRSQSSSATLTTHEVELFAGRFFRNGKSSTVNLSEDQKIERAGRIYRRTGRRVPLEDAIELVTAKVAALKGGAIVCPPDKTN